MKPVAVIPVKNRLDLTKPLVETLLSHKDCKVVLFDNGSKDGTAEWAARVKGLSYVGAPDSTLHEMWNAGCTIAGVDGQPAVILNNDIELDGEPAWVSRLVAPLEYGWGALCPNYDSRRDYRAVMPLQGISAGREDGTGGLSGFAFALSPSVMGWYRFPVDAKWWFGDTDLCRTLDARGVPYGMVLDVGLTHIGGGSQTAKDHDIAPQCIKDRAWFESKWGPIGA